MKYTVRSKGLLAEQKRGYHMRERIYWNRDWQFTTEYCDELLEKEFTGEVQTVTLPHTVAETPFHYCDESIYEMVSG